MKVKNRSEVEALINGTERAGHQARAHRGSKNETQIISEEDSVEISRAQELYDFIQSSKQNKRVAELKALFENEGYAGLNALYKSEDVADKLSAEIDSFIYDFREQE